jgi:hypothetical protein
MGLGTAHYIFEDVPAFQAPCEIRGMARRNLLKDSAIGIGKVDGFIVLNQVLASCITARLSNQLSIYVITTSFQRRPSAISYAFWGVLKPHPA